MDSHTLQVLELDKVLSLVSEYADSQAAREEIRNFIPLGSIDEVRSELGLVSEARDLLAERPPLPIISLPSPSLIFTRLAVEGVVLTAAELSSLGAFVRISLVVEKIMERGKTRYPGLAALFVGPSPDPKLALEIEKALDPERGVKDDASPLLARLARSQRDQRERIVTELEILQRNLGEESLSQEDSITLRNGRYVLPVLVRSRNRVRGIIHDKSRTGQTLFIEPSAVVDFNNALRETEIEIERERERILSELSAHAVSQREELRGAYRSLVRFDSLAARARCAIQWECRPPVIERGVHLKIVQGRHPLLFNRAIETGTVESVVPLSLEFEDGERTLLVSGPNAGGKTVMLKTIGLLTLMSFCGLHIPAEGGTLIPYLNGLFVDIGDEQSIESDLSTFSSHVVRLVEILKRAGPGSLVLLDEVGVGTDPVEGVAIARAVLEELAERDARTVATTHYGQLKALADKEGGIVNGSLSFDPERLVPTFRFVKGLPGRSMGLTIGERFGMPRDIIGRARSYADREGMALEDLLGELESLRGRLSQELAQLAERQRHFEISSRELAEERARTQRERWEAVKTAREESREVYLKARRELEEAISKLSGSGDREALVREARKMLESGLARISHGAPSRPKGTPGFTPRVGDLVLLGDLGRTGKVTAVMPERGEVEVEASGKSLRIPLEDVAPVPQEGRDGAGRREGSLPRIEMDVDDSGDTLDIRGITREEVRFELARAIDTAILGGLGLLKIIHGKGDGVLRDEVQKILAGEKRVRQFRMGRPWEGGSGVTIAEIVDPCRA
jgi:DNA mismatch repair protein MutS2